MRRRLTKILIAVVVVLIVAGFVAVLSIDGIARRGVEFAGSQALGVTTTLQSLTLGLFRGQVRVSLGSLMKDTVVVPQLELQHIDVNLEKKNGKANYAAILDNLKGQDKQDKDTQPGKKFIIQNLLIRDVTVHADVLPVGGKATRMDVTIPEIRLKDVGSDSDKGVVLAQVANVVVKAVLTAVVRKAGNVLPADVIGGLGEGLTQLEGMSKFGLQTAGDLANLAGQVLNPDQAQKGGKEVLDGAGKVLEDVGGLLSGGDKKNGSKKGK
jgi:hypothetical protein